MFHMQNNLLFYRNKSKLKQKDVAKAIGEEIRTYQRWEVGEREPSIDKLKSLAKFYNVTVNDLISDVPPPGTGEVSPAGGNPPVLEATPAPPEAEPGADAGESKLIAEFEVDASAGGGSFIENCYRLPPCPLPASTFYGVRHSGFNNLAIIKVKGDSMQTTLMSGERVVVDMADRKAASGIFIFHHYDSFFIKRLQPVGGGRVRILSDNPAYEPYELAAADMAISGRLIMIVGRKL